MKCTISFMVCVPVPRRLCILVSVVGALAKTGDRVTDRAWRVTGDVPSRHGPWGRLGRFSFGVVECKGTA